MSTAAETEEVRAEEIEEVTGAESNATTGLAELDELFHTVTAPGWAAMEACMQLIQMHPSLRGSIEAFVTARLEEALDGRLDFEMEEAPVQRWRSFMAGYKSRLEETPPAETSEPAAGSAFAVDKASGRLRRVVDWLASRDRQTKLAILLSHALLRNERNIQYEGNYDGNVGNEVLAVFERDVFEGEPMEGADEFVRGYTLALDQMDG